MKTKLIYVLLGCLFVSCTNKTIAFRCDDIRLDLDSQNVAMLRLFDKYDMHITCAVIPFNKQGEPLVVNNEALEYLKHLHKKGNVEIALHGYKHCWTGNKGELDGLPYEEQYAMLSAGKQLLDSVFNTNVVSFVPPRNWYDENTILVLEQLGFKNISACVENELSLHKMAMNQMPFSCGELHWLTQELRYSWGGNGFNVSSVRIYG